MKRRIWLFLACEAVVVLSFSANFILMPDSRLLAVLWWYRPVGPALIAAALLPVVMLIIALFNMNQFKRATSLELLVSIASALFGIVASGVLFIGLAVCC